VYYDDVLSYKTALLVGGFQSTHIQI